MDNKEQPVPPPYPPQQQGYVAPVQYGMNPPAPPSYSAVVGQQPQYAPVPTQPHQVIGIQQQQQPAMVGVQQPVYVVTNQPVRIHSRHPTALTCPHCMGAVVTSTRSEIGAAAWLSCCFIALFGFWLGCCLIPFCIPDLQDTFHECPNCHKVIDVYKPL